MKSTSCCTALFGHLNLWKSLIDHKNFHVDGADNGEWTTLDFCARNRSYELVWFFADRGVGVGLEDKVVTIICIQEHYMNIWVCARHWCASITLM